MAGAPQGNNNATKNKPWRDALDRAIKQSDPDRLRNIAEKLLNKAETGDIQALKEVGDRLDGRPHQSLEVSGDPLKPLITRVEKVIVDPKDQSTT